MGDPNSRTCTFVSSPLARGYKTSKNGEIKNGERFSNRPMVHSLEESHFNNSAKANSVFCCSVYGVDLVDGFWGVLMDCGFLTCFDFRGSRVGRRLSASLPCRKKAKIVRSRSKRAATLSPFLILLSSLSLWGGKLPLVICRLPVFFNGVILLFARLFT